MKAEIKTKEKGFEPIELNITIESMEELKELCTRLNVRSSDINKLDESYGIIGDETTDLWIVLNSLYQELNK